MKSVLSILTCLLLLSSIALWAQPSVQKLKANLAQSQPNLVEEFLTNMPIKEMASARLNKNSQLPTANITQWLADKMDFRSGMDALSEKKSATQIGNYQINKFQQYFKGIPVEHGIINITSKNNWVTSFQLEFYPIATETRTSPSYPASEAFNKAKEAIHARVYAWEDSSLPSPIPQPELVFIADIYRNNLPVLAYKFHILASKPLIDAFVYIDANNGNHLLTDNRIYHANSVGTADTRYSGRQNITTNFDNTLPAGQQFQLSQVRNGHSIKTFNMNYQILNNVNANAATVFTDDDNNWTKAEYGDSATLPMASYLHNAALEAHFNMSVISDYWKLVHSRSSYNNNNAPIHNVIHVNDNNTNSWLNNAFWSGNYNAMFFGDGDGTTNNPPQVSIDDCGHEFGHAITQETSQLVYRWESGALNEGFSDIWAACATNYLKKQFPAIIGKKLDWRLFEESSNVLGGVNAGLRDMADPSIFGQPKFYKGLLWDPGTYEACPIPIGDVNDPNYNDHCGVHDNSGVLNKWFYIVAHGDTAQNEVLRNYSVAGIGFGKADSLAYLTELNLTPNSGYKTARNVSINAAITLWGNNAEAQMVRDAWLAVGVDTAVFNMSNTPAFTTNSFSSIAVGKHGTIWAGTTTNANNTSDGVYRYNGKIWEKAPFLTNNAVAAIQADRNGGIWIAQYGRTGAQALTGGMNYLADSAFSNNTYFGVTTNGLISRNSRSLYVDTFNLTPSNRSVWVSSLAQITVGVSGTGGVSVGFTPGASGNFIKLTKGIEDTSTTGGSQAIAGDKNEVWAFSSLNYLNRSQIVRFSTATADSIGILDSTNIPVLPKQFYVKAMYFDALGKKWLGMLNTGLVVRDEAGHWVTVDTAIFRTIFPYGTIVNNNAIVGDRLGNVYIGTTNGLVYYNKGPLNQVSSFRRFTTAHGLPSNNIRAIAVDTIHYKLLLATDNGIVFFDQICNGWRDCQDQAPTSKSSATTIASGNWSDPSIWNTNKIPDFNTIVRIQNAIQVDIQASCNSLTALPGGNINVQAGKTLKIANGEEEPNPTINEH